MCSTVLDIIRILELEFGPTLIFFAILQLPGLLVLFGYALYKPEDYN